MTGASENSVAEAEAAVKIAFERYEVLYALPIDQAKLVQRYVVEQILGLPPVQSKATR